VVAGAINVAQGQQLRSECVQVCPARDGDEGAVSPRNTNSLCLAAEAGLGAEEATVSACGGHALPDNGRRYRRTTRRGRSPHPPAASPSLRCRSQQRCR
jgi:hypothetical protein